MIDESLDATTGANVRLLREALGYSQTQLASRVGDGFQQSTIVKIEKGTRPLRLAEAVAVAGALSVEVSDLYRAERPALAQLAGSVHDVRMLAESVREVVAELEEFRLNMRHLVLLVDDVPPDLRKAVDKWGRDGLVESCVEDARNSFLVRMEREGLAGTVEGGADRG